MELWTAGQMVLTPPSSIMVQVVEVPFKRKTTKKKKIKKNNLSVALKSDASVKTKNAPGCCGGTGRDRSGIPGY